jgi:hypothetical protein|tara:strand:- start:487 stop:876 length:390 start_codon:yes stop_codon:yes gene_type:complete
MDKNLNHVEIGDSVINWCWDNLGSSKFQSHEAPDVYYDWVASDLLGEWVSSENEITIYVNEIDSLKEFIQTIIHEYVHYLQSPVWYSRYWNRMRKDFKAGENYYGHPYEAEAEETAVEYWKVCKKDMGL